MKVKLKQHYQDAQVHLYPGQEYDGELAPYLLRHRMAVAVEEPRPEPAPADPVEEPRPEPAPEPKRARRKQ